MSGSGSTPEPVARDGVQPSDHRPADQRDAVEQRDAVDRPDDGSTVGSGRGKAKKDPLRGSRTSGIWVAVLALVVLLALLSVFVLQNTQLVEVSYFGWQGEAPLAAALLIAVAAGLLIAVIAGSLRILQLRRRVRRERKR